MPGPDCRADILHQGHYIIVKECFYQSVDDVNF